MRIRSACILLSCVLGCNVALGQKADSLKSQPDTGVLKKKLAKGGNAALETIKQKQSLIKPSKSIQQGSGALKDLDSKLTQGLKNGKADQIKVGLELEDAVQYQPLPPGSIGNIVPVQGINNPKFLNKVSVKGNITAWGIPLNFNFTNDQNNVNGLGDVRNSLFKFDYSPSQLNGLLKSDLQQYYDLRKSAFGGLDLTGYAQARLKEKIKAQSPVSGSKENSNVLTEYLSKPENVTGLLNLNEDQIRKKLKGVVETQSQNGMKTANRIKGSAMDSLNQQNRNRAIADLSNSPKLNQYFKDPKQAKELKYMTEAQINEKLTALSRPDSAKRSKGESPLNLETPDQAAVKSELIKKMSREIFLARVSDSPVKLGTVMDKAKLQLDQRVMNGNSNNSNNKVPDVTSLNKDKISGALNASEKTVLNQQIDSVALTITDIKSKLKKSGVDVGKLLAMQNATRKGNGDPVTLDNASDLLSNKPHNAIQSFFTRVQALKIGSFGNNVPGSTKGDDLFIEGTHLTYKVGTMPITLGYGNVNDIGSAKDVNYQASDYNSPKSVSYISLKVKDGMSGNSTFSIIGSGINHTSNYNNYAVPSSSSNNVALTISKLFNAGDLGKFTVDVSKSTTLAYQDLTPDAGSVLDKKAGLDYSGSNLTQALAFGFNHELDVKEAGLTEAAYFNYSGSGYQNPGNNGFGGGGLRMGGNVKKALLKNKLSLSLRTDFNDKSISYTNNNKWKTYQVQLDSRYNITRKFNISLKYLNGGTDKQVDNVITPVYTSQKYQVDGNLSYKIGRNYSISHLTIGKQDYSNTFMTTTGSSLLMVNYMQSVILGRNSLTLSTFYNKELSDYKLIGNLLNSDLTYQYTIFRKVNLATAGTYLDNAGNARQVGIRQSIQVLAGKNFDVDTYIDLRHNIIAPLYPDLYAACRAELSLKYHIKY